MQPGQIALDGRTSLTIKDPDEVGRFSLSAQFVSYLIAKLKTLKFPPPIFSSLLKPLPATI
jgi:hypothetical protein